MSSKIKVDTIENVAGSGNVSLGSGHNLVVPGNITGQGTAAITSNATVGGTLTTTGASTFTGGLKTGGTAGVSSAPIATIISGGNSLEWGHGNSAGYRSTLGALSGGGQPFIAFSAEHGTNANTYRTRGLKGHVIQTQNTGGLHFKALQTATGDNQTGTETMAIDNNGIVTMPNQPAFAAVRTAGDSTSIQTFVYNSVIYNIGNHYDSSNGRFTAPVAGRYQFNVMMSHNGSGTASLGFFRPQINGSSHSYMFPIYPAIDHLSICFSFTLNLNASDYVSINTGTTAQVLGAGNNHNHFSGFLVG